MAVPSSMNMKFKFPAFRNLNDGDVEFAIEEAVVAVGATSSGWASEANHTLAIMYYAAHLLQMAILRGSSTAGGGTGQIIASESTPELSRTYVTPPFPSLDEPIDFTMTVYGVRYMSLVTKNFPAILTVGSAVRMG